MPDRLKINDVITIELTQTTNFKILIFRNDRNDLPHLTISFGNLSKEIDFHLTTRAAGKEEYIDIAKIQESEIAKSLSYISVAFQHYIATNIRKLKKVRPGWLNRKGYLIYFLDNDSQNKFVDRIAPDKKYHGKNQRIFKSFALYRYLYSAEAESNMFYSSALHDIEKNGCDIPLFAFRVRGKHKPKIIPIGLIKNLNGKTSWCRLDKITNGMIKAVEPLASACFKQILPLDAWVKIYDELHLEDFGIERV